VVPVKLRRAFMARIVLSALSGKRPGASVDRRFDHHHDRILE
jgi:hypothetical protein